MGAGMAGAKKAAVVVALVAAGLGAWRWQASRRPARPNLVLVTIDTLRADHIGAYGSTLARTPALDGLAARGARFTHAQSAVPLTGPSHATILTGLYPPAHGVRDNIVFTLDPRHRTLASLLGGQGYRTAAFVGAYPVAAAFGFRQGFDVFSEDFKESPIPGAGAQRPANEVVDAALGWLSKPAEAPFFVWTHLYDPHAPYDPPEPYRSTLAGHPYDGEIAFADAQVGRLLDWVRASGHDKDTVIAILSDHGESLGEHGEVTHAVLAYEATLHVPSSWPGRACPRARPSRRASPPSTSRRLCCGCSRWTRRRP
jgi:arylsulfatase A-like enzyme